jgi:ATP-binding cassette subfamily C protein
MLGKLWRGTRTMKAVAAAHKAARLLMTGGMVCTGLILSIKGEASGGSMVASNMMLARLLLPFEQFAVSWRSWIAAADAWRRLSALIGETGSKRGVHPLPCRSGRLHVERLVYIPPGADKPALRGVTFDIEPGQILGVIGPSGAGKSTLARLAVGTAEPTSGGVYLDGNSTWLWERSDFGRHVGYMPQQTVLLDGTVGENIARMADGDPASIMAAAQAAGIHDAIMRLPQGYATALSEAGFVLSGGQRQRVALARALYGEPKLLVLDEPNSSLDADGEKVLLDAVVAAKQRGAAVLMIAHRPSLVAVADRLLVLKDGLIDRFGERERVLQALKAPPVRLVKGPEASARSAAP